MSKQTENRKTERQRDRHRGKQKDEHNGRCMRFQTRLQKTNIKHQKALDKLISFTLEI